MSKRIIATLVGAVLLFIWQFLSWSLLNVHAAEQMYTPNQDRILEFLGGQLEEGHYFLPTVPPGTSQEDAQAAMEAAAGQPWATISYHSAMENTMTMNLIRGFAIDLVSVFLLVWLLLNMAKLNFSTALLASLAIGIIGYLTIPYLGAIWFKTPSLGYLIDAVVGWGLVGVWLGWYLNR